MKCGTCFAVMEKGAKCCEGCKSRGLVDISPAIAATLRDQRDKKPKAYACFLCPRKVESAYSLKQHLNFKHKQCRACGYYFAGKSELFEHLKLEHPSLLRTIVPKTQEPEPSEKDPIHMPCPICHRYFTGTSALDNHMHKFHPTDTGSEKSETVSLPPAGPRQKGDWAEISANDSPCGEPQSDEEQQYRDVCTCRC